MTTRLSRSYLHSCLKVPIDPCNNCPAPIYNRPKLYLGQLTTTQISGTAKTANNTEFQNVDSVLANSGIRSLAKLYDSIPGVTIHFKFNIKMVVDFIIFNN